MGRGLVPGRFLNCPVPGQEVLLITGCSAHPLRDVTEGSDQIPLKTGLDCLVVSLIKLILDTV